MILAEDNECDLVDESCATIHFGIELIAAAHLYLYLNGEKARYLRT